MVKFNKLVIVKIINKANKIPNKLKCNGHAIAKLFLNVVKFGVGSSGDSGSGINVILIPITDVVTLLAVFHVSLLVAEKKPESLRLIQLYQQAINDEIF